MNPQEFPRVAGRECQYLDAVLRRADSAPNVAPPTFVRAIAVAALLVTVPVALTGCSGGSDTAAPAPPPSARAALTAAPATIESVGSPVTLDQATQDRLVALAQKYVDSALLAPLETGTTGADYPTLFDDGVRGDATGADAAVLTLAPVGKVERFDQQAQPVTISGLADADGNLVFLAAKFSVTVEAPTPTGTGTFTNDVELTAAPTGDDWLVTAYRVVATRQVPEATSTTTAARSS